MSKDEFLIQNSHLAPDYELLTLWAIKELSNEKGEIILVKSVKKRIAEKLGFKVGSISVYVCHLHKKGLINQTSHATYKVPLIAT